MVELVSFDVDGVIYKVNRTTVNKVPQTMLFHSVGSNSTAVHIDCNKSRFEYIVDYMRFGEVFLPVGISKAALLCEMNYLDFTNANPNNIKSSIETVQEPLPTPINSVAVPEVERHKIIWDVTRAVPGFVMEDNHHSVTKIDSESSYRAVFVTNGFKSGVHYWSIKVASVVANITDGVSKSLDLTATHVHPGMAGDKGGVGYYNQTGS
jgi:BTB/POZ domain